RQRFISHQKSLKHRFISIFQTILPIFTRISAQCPVEAGMELVLRDRPFPPWTIARANQIMHHDLNNREAAAELASCPLLASNWQRTLLNRAAKNINPDSTPRLLGEN
ncbi:hypothetical protein H6G17_29665, partial [Chroococcidiopsis sp. FACHB-1243]|uniref:3-alpha domain-containing protein n=1 Tax=Chroococcidiopsis sp. [FACHB-1243] TaxID=2692781 RepID=UPI0019A20004